jgi:hypothetical protein
MSAGLQAGLFASGLILGGLLVGLLAKRLYVAWKRR